MSTRSAERRYGRQGGGWVDAGFDPTKLRAEFGAIRLRAQKAHERDPEKYPPWPDHSQPSTRHLPSADGPYTFEGAARMAEARLAAGLPLSDVDEDALRRHPAPARSTDPL